MWTYTTTLIRYFHDQVTAEHRRCETVLSCFAQPDGHRQVALPSTDTSSMGSVHFPSFVDVGVVSDREFCRCFRENSRGALSSMRLLVGSVYL